MPTIHHLVGKHTPSQQIKVAFIIPFIVHEHKYQPFGPHFLSYIAYSRSIFRIRGSSETEISVLYHALPRGVLKIFSFWFFAMCIIHNLKDHTGNKISLRVCCQAASVWDIHLKLSKQIPKYTEHGLEKERSGV